MVALCIPVFMTSKNMEVASFMITIIVSREDLLLHIDTFLVNIGVDMQRKTTLDFNKRVMYSFYSICWIYISVQVLSVHRNSQKK